jgi:hypothetical protein
MKNKHKSKETSGGKKTHEKPRKPDFTILNKP